MNFLYIESNEIVPNNRLILTPSIICSGQIYSFPGAFIANSHAIVMTVSFLFPWRTQVLK
jgi:hypothetical protein